MNETEYEALYFFPPMLVTASRAVRGASAEGAMHAEADRVSENLGNQHNTGIPETGPSRSGQEEKLTVACLCRGLGSEARIGTNRPDHASLRSSLGLCCDKWWTPTSPSLTDFYPRACVVNVK